MASLPPRFFGDPGARPPQCATCKHFRASTDGATCDAFPDGIPRVILLDEHDHTEPYPGDNGIRYEPIDEAA